MRLGSQDLVVLPVPMYNLPQRQPARSWRPWTGLQTPEAVEQEVGCAAAKVGITVQTLKA
jgi:hypothetical protein